jgi:multiple sugar transport system permease protein
MLDFIFNLFFWAVIGAVPGFYAAYAKRYDPKWGLAAGAGIGILIGEIGVRLDIISGSGSAIATIFAVCVILGLIVPFGTYDQRVTARGRINNLAYALTIPTILIVFGIVIFPLVWNIIFSVRDISTTDLRDVELFDLSGASLDNFEAQMGFRIDNLPCEMDEGGACLVEDGETVYPDARRYIGTSYRGYREVNSASLFGNYYALGLRNEDFYSMVWRSIFYTLSGTILAILFGLVAALLVREKFPGRNIFRGFILFPYIAPVISVAFIWRALLTQNGLINQTFGSNISFINTGDKFLSIAIPLVVAILFQAWRYFPFAFLFLLARIQAIPEDMYEAAKVDGATPVQRLFFITLPQLRAVFGTLFLLRFIWTFNKFDDVYLLTGINSRTKVIPVQIFEYLFFQPTTPSNIGQASAVAVIMAFVLALILIIYFRFFLVDEA